jgi:histidyl-tRNA synthetase
MTDRLCGPCAEHFAEVRVHLDALAVPYRVESGLVRGLDYYTRTAFEFYVRGREGQQQALAGGGRYDGLVELLGGRPTPGIGFGIGLDRLILALADQADGAAAVSGPEPPAAVVVGADPDATIERLRIATDLRAAGIAARADLARRKLGKQLEAASKEHAHFAVIVGDVQLRDLPAGTQKPIPLADLAREITRAHGAHHHGPVASRDG